MQFTRLLCKIGLHNWETRTIVDENMIYTYMWCKRENCIYESARCYDKEKSKLARMAE